MRLCDGGVTGSTAEMGLLTTMSVQWDDAEHRRQRFEGVCRRKQRAHKAFDAYTTAREETAHQTDANNILTKGRQAKRYQDRCDMQHRANMTMSRPADSVFQIGPCV